MNKLQKDMNPVQQKPLAMTATATIAANRAEPLFKKAAEIEERIQFELVKYGEQTANLLQLASECGGYLEQADITLKEAGVDVKFDNMLHMHAPNIDPNRAKAYRAHSKGKWIDPRQIFLPGYAPPKQITEECERTAPAEWEQAWGFVRKLQRVEWDKWPEEQRTLTRDNLGAVVKHFGGSVVWE